MFGYNKPQLMAIVFCHKERGISVEEENHLVTVGIVRKSKTILVLLASPNTTRDADGTLFTISPLDSTFLGKSTLRQSHMQRAPVSLRTLDG